MKTRQQRLAEERAGHPSSPPQQLPIKTRVPRRTRAKQPSVGEAPAYSPAPLAGSGQVPVAAGALAPAAQLAVPGEAHALLRLWVDVSPEVVASGRPVNGPTIELAIPSSEVADLLAFVETLRQAEFQRQQTPTRMAPQNPPARIEPALQRSPLSVQPPSTSERAFTVAPHITPAHIDPAIQSNSAIAQSPRIINPDHTMYMAPHCTPPRVESAVQSNSALAQSLKTNNPIHAMSHMAPHTTPTRVEPAIQSNPALARSPNMNNPDHTVYMAPHTTPTRVESAIQSNPALAQSPKINNPDHAVYMAPHTTSTHVQPAIQSNPALAQSPKYNIPDHKVYMALHTSPTRVEPAIQISSAFTQSPKINNPIHTMSHMAPHTTPIRTEPAIQSNSALAQSPKINNPIHTMSHMAPHTTPNRIEPAIQSNSALAQSAKINKPIYTMSLVAPRSTPTRIEPALQNTPPPVRSPNINKIISRMSHSVMGQTANKNSTQQLVPSLRETPTTANISAMSRNGSLPLAYSTDGAALYGNVPITTSASGLNASFDDHEVQLDDEASINGDVDMEDVSNSDIPPSNLAEEATQSTLERSLETPQRSGWGLGNLIQSAHYSMARRFGFSPLSPVSERSEPTPPSRIVKTSQRQAETPAPMQTEKTTPKKPKKKNSVSTSARVVRASKGKRWGSPDTVPIPEDKSYGLGEAESYGSSEEDDVMEQQPGKLRRTSKSADFSSQAAGNPDQARPYTGSMYEKSTAEYKGGNVFSEYYAFSKTEEAGAKRANVSVHCTAKTHIPITNLAGTFKVPSPGDSDWNSSENEEEEETHTTASEDVTPSRTKESEALRRARDKAMTHKPRYPSRLGRSSMTCSSPPVSNEAETNPGPTRRPIYDAYEQWCKTTPSAVTAAVDRMPVYSNLAGNAFEEGLNNAGPASRANFNAYEEWCKAASPAVLAVLGMMPVDANLAGAAFKGGLSDFATSAKRAEPAVA